MQKSQLVFRPSHAPWEPLNSSKSFFSNYKPKLKIPPPRRKQKGSIRFLILLNVKPLQQWRKRQNIRGSECQTIFSNKRNIYIYSVVFPDVIAEYISLKTILSIEELICCCETKLARFNNYCICTHVYPFWIDPHACLP